MKLLCMHRYSILKRSCQHRQRQLSSWYNTSSVYCHWTMHDQYFALIDFTMKLQFWAKASFSLPLIFLEYQEDTYRAHWGRPELSRPRVGSDDRETLDTQTHWICQTGYPPHRDGTRLQSKKIYPHSTNWHCVDKKMKTAGSRSYWVHLLSRAMVNNNQLTKLATKDHINYQ